MTSEQIANELANITFQQPDDETHHSDCSAINDTLLEHKAFMREFTTFATLNMVANVDPHHMICHLMIQAFRLGLSCANKDKDISELEKMFHKKADA